VQRNFALADHYDGVRRYLALELGRLDNSGLAASILGDWLSPGGYTQPPEDTRLTAAAYVYRGLRILADMAAALGRTADAEDFQKQAADLAERYNASSAIAIAASIAPPATRATGSVRT
jgi:alpha-L-rhamnosidase